MEHIGIDVHKVESQICTLTEGGELVERPIRTQRERFAVLLGERPRAKILIEASTESEWAARCLEGLGHQVVVADPNFAAMYATRSRKVKTEVRDARTLAEACKLGAYRPAHRTSERQRHVRAQLSVRGHSDPKITERRYGHLLPDFMKSEVDRLRFGLDRLAPTLPGRGVAGTGSDSPDFAAGSQRLGTPVVRTGAGKQEEAGTPGYRLGNPGFFIGGVYGTRTRGLRRDRPAL
jgi:transposase